MRLIERIRAAVNARPPIEGLIAGDSIADRDIPPVPAAVLIAIVTGDEPGLILTRRADHVRRHPGQIAFPGGRIDNTDAGAVAAALREAEEEIGLPPDRVEILGGLDTYRTVTGFDIIPIAALVPPKLPFAPAPDEVAAVFEVPLAYVLDPAHQQIRSMLWQGRQRQHYEIEWEGQRIWGATAAILRGLYDRLYGDPPG